MSTLRCHEIHGQDLRQWKERTDCLASFYFPHCISHYYLWSHQNITNLRRILSVEFIVSSELGDL